jgi:hypothetical protein
MRHDFAPLQPGWSEVLHVRAGQAVARLMHAGAEVHFEVHPEHRHRVIYRGVTREFLRPLFEQHGFLTTKVPLLDDTSRRFVQRIGFELTWSDEDYDYFMLTALPFGKKEK